MLYSRKFRLAIVTVFAIVCLVTSLPSAAIAAPLAQQGQLDPDTLVGIQRAASLVEQSMGALTSSAPVVEDNGSPPVDGELVEHEYLGVTIAAPANWQVENGSGDTVFDIKDETSGMKGMVAFTGDAFPGLITLPMFEILADMLVQTMGPSAELAAVSRLETHQGLPALRIAYVGAEDAEVAGDGVIYLIGTGDNAYGVIIGAPSETWPSVEPLVDELAVSLLVEEDLVTLQTATDGDLVFDDPAGAFAVTIPQGWHVTPTRDEELTMLVADPDIRFAAAVTGRAGLDGNDEALQALVAATAGDVDEQTANDLVGGVLEALDIGGDSMVFNPELTNVFSEVGDYMGVIRLGGAFEVDDGVEMPLVTYLGVGADSVGLLMIFGAPDEVVAEEEALLKLLGTIEFSE